MNSWHRKISDLHLCCLVLYRVYPYWFFMVVDPTPADFVQRLTGRALWPRNTAQWPWWLRRDELPKTMQGVSHMPVLPFFSIRTLGWGPRRPECLGVLFSQSNPRSGGCPA